jgi:hypothetical protein
MDNGQWNNYGEPDWPSEYLALNFLYMKIHCIY